jgi:hypothetical protein
VGICRGKTFQKTENTIYVCNIYILYIKQIKYYIYIPSTDSFENKVNDRYLKQKFTLSQASEIDKFSRMSLSTIIREDKF